MKTKKIITLVLSLCIVISVFSVCAFAVSAEPQIAGGWTFSDISAQNITEKEQAILDKALAENGGVDFEPKDVIATQVVGGRNYAFLCKGTPVTLNPVPYWAIVTVFADPQGNASLMNISSIDVANVKVRDSIEEEMSGAWSSEVKENVAPLPAEVKSALENHTGVELSPIAVLGTQTVAGINYRILAYGTLITATPRTDLYVADVFANVNGAAEIQTVSVFDLASYVTRASVEESSEEISDQSSEEVSDQSSEEVSDQSSQDVSGQTSKETSSETSSEASSEASKDTSKAESSKESEKTTESSAVKTEESSTVTTTGADTPDTGSEAPAAILFGVLFISAAAIVVFKKTEA